MHQETHENLRDFFRVFLDLAAAVLGISIDHLRANVVRLPRYMRWPAWVVHVWSNFTADMTCMPCDRALRYGAEPLGYSTH